MGNSLQLEESIVIDRREMGGLIPFSLVSIPSFQCGVLIKDGTPVQVYTSGRRFIFHFWPFSRYELWLVSTKLSHIRVGEDKISYTVDDWQIKGELTVQLRITDPGKLIAYDKPLGLLGDRLYSILQGRIQHYSLSQLGAVRDEIEAEVLKLGGAYASTLGFAVDMVSFTYQPGIQDPRRVMNEVIIRRAGVPPVISMGVSALPPGGSAICPYCNAKVRINAQFCSKCGRSLG